MWIIFELRIKRYVSILKRYERKNTMCKALERIKGFISLGNGENQG
jgi:hypothetical protein